jgi:hypothetical protein
LEVAVKLNACAKAEQACDAHELVADCIVVLEVILEAPLIVECTQA